MIVLNCCFSAYAWYDIEKPFRMSDVETKKIFEIGGLQAHDRILVRDMNEQIEIQACVFPPGYFGDNADVGSYVLDLRTGQELTPPDVTTVVDADGGRRKAPWFSLESNIGFPNHSYYYLHYKKVILSCWPGALNFNEGDPLALYINDEPRGPENEFVGYLNRYWETDSHIWVWTVTLNRKPYVKKYTLLRPESQE